MDQMVGMIRTAIKELKNVLAELGSALKTANNPKNRPDLLTMKVKGVTALGALTPQGFVVFKGSQAVGKERPSMSVKPFSQRRRREMISNRTLTKTKNGYTFSRDVTFSSPTAAGEIIQGGTAQGPALWKNRAGRTLKDLGFSMSRRKR